MAEQLFSPSWYRVARLKPRMRGHTRIYRHQYRGEIWYVLQDHAKGRYYRFTPTAYHIIGLMDGRRTVQELWDLASARFGDEGPTQGEVVHLLAQLHGADVLLCDVPPDTEELLQRAQRIEQAQFRQSIRSPLAIKIPLIDPEKFLSRTAWLTRPLFGIAGVLLWLGVVGAAAVLVALHWPELTEDVIDRVLSAQNLVAIYLIYPVVKALHELGHGYAVKYWGGEVHEMGIMFLVFVPVPYVDASAASEFRAKHRRLIVGAAGILVEMFVAALALFVWVALEPGAARSVAYNVILIGSITTLFFNANPLLRFDGYYIFSDLVEIPNLAQRGTQYLGYLFKRYLFRIEDIVAPYTGPGERFWFVAYSAAAFVYRMFIYVSIVLVVAGKFFFIGILLAIWAIINMVVVPLFKALRFVASSPALRERRSRGLLLTGGALIAAFLLLFVAPFPSWTRTEGIVWIPEQAMVRAEADGFVERVVAEPDARVRRGDILVECSDPIRRARASVLRARVGELQARYDAAVTVDQVQARIIDEELRNTRHRLARAEERLASLIIRSPSDGRFILPRAQDLPGRYLQQGDLVAYVLEVDRPIIRVVVPQSNIDRVRRRTLEVEVRFVERLDRRISAAVRREVPEAEARLPSSILGSAGGGAIAIDPFEQSGRKTFKKFFQFDLELHEPVDRVFLGGRVFVRFDHGFEPVGPRVYRNVRRLFLRRFNV